MMKIKTLIDEDKKNQKMTEGPFKGFLALVLHAHLPFVRRHEPDDSLAAQWFCQAMSVTYLPLIKTIDRMVRDQLPFRLTLSLTPTLLTLLSEGLLQERLAAYLGKLAKADARRARELIGIYESCNGNLIAKFKQYQDAGSIEIITSAATHGYLPLMRTEEAVYAQIATAVRAYEQYFGRAPRGIWLPECGFTAGIDRVVKRCGLDYFFVHESAVTLASPPPQGVCTPLLTPHGVSAFPLDSACAAQAWSVAGGAPNKFRRRQRQTDSFIEGCLQQTMHHEQRHGRKPILVSACDTARFGQWMQDDPLWIETLCRKLSEEGQPIGMITPSEYLQGYPPSETGWLNDSSWGRNQSAEEWLQPGSAWMYRHLHQAEKRMIELTQVSEPSSEKPLLQRALNQAARELMLAQTSDWAFMMNAGTGVDYAVSRTKEHLAHFQRLSEQIGQAQVNEEELAALEETDCLFPLIDYWDYASIHRPSPIPIIPDPQQWRDLITETSGRPHIFMLSWEYPPKQVGGLSRAVHELSEALAAAGEIIHVITPAYPGAPYFEKRNGVYIHRLPVDSSGDTHLYHWTFEMNLAMIDHLVRWKESGGRIDLLHAHDWMVTYAARELKHTYGIPLVATVHATEWGRNQGTLATQLQHNIHNLEWRLTYEANLVFVCSSYMKEEVQRIFSLAPDKVAVYPNGIRIPNSAAGLISRPDYLEDEDKVIFFIGRLVYEKGIQVLIDAMPAILAQIPQARLVIAGSGPMEEELRSRAAPLGARVWFAGFADEAYRQQLYQAADVCAIPSLYEPFGLVALEAMASRTPLVLSDTGGLAEIIRHGIEGYKSLPGHTESLSWHITELLRQPESAARMAESAYQTLQRDYQWSQIAQKMRSEYRRF
ncbi:1,4-alpha-glucan branching protein domain-containing protein [Paenibacillus aestuarii]|uniref:1,4-alpha-glucan branching protein domain-containing protein n=1 Tax=Paenibacillus aestuarii TaxID=516965 RepID=A0ABW0K8P0_9BACL|nr:1,4-alpha-glucan branching protein domain-containing protein [Paenibacillus aestuarii]